jgi:hypothetical protein
MIVRFHPHARQRMEERGTTEEEVRITVERGEKFPAKFGRAGFRCNFSFDGEWCGTSYRFKQVEAYAVSENADWLVITVITRYY